MTTTESIRNWFMQCPAVNAVLGFNADYLGDEINECTIFSVPTPIKYSEDVMGNISYKGNQSLNFIFALRAAYSDDVTQNLKNLQFFDQIKDWMYAQNTKKNFPQIEEGDVRSIMPIQSEFISGANSNTASYQMRCELKYWRSE